MIKTELARTLPSYMVPTRCVWVDAVPRLTSGKIDRHALRRIPLPSPTTARDGDGDAPADEAQAELFRVLGTLFPGRRGFRLADDFFNDLGGHSLFAARAVSELRRDARFQHMSIQKVYAARTLGAIAKEMSPRAEASDGKPRATNRRAPPQCVGAGADGTTDYPPVAPLHRKLLCGLAQLAAYPALITVRVLLWLLPFAVYVALEASRGVGPAIGFAVAAYVGIILATALLAPAAYRVVTAGMRVGQYPLYGVAYFRLWLGEQVLELAPRLMAFGSPLYAVGLRMAGARVGRGVYMGSAYVRHPRFVTIGDDVSVGSAVTISTMRVDRGVVSVGAVSIGDRTFVGSCCAIMGDVAIGSDARLDGMTALAWGARVGDLERWDGAPASLVARASRASDAPTPASALFTAAECVVYLVGGIAVAVLFYLPIFPTIALVSYLTSLVVDSVAALGGAQYIVSALLYFAIAMPVAAALIAATFLLTAAMRHVVLGPVREGSYSLHSLAYFRRWVLGQVLEQAFVILYGVFATVYAPLLFRALGAKIGPRTEISSAISMVPDLVELGEGVFVADLAVVGDDHVELGVFTARKTRVGDRTFMGNGSYVPDGTTLPDNVLIGVQSKAPSPQQGGVQVQAGQTWVGSPPVLLPRRDDRGRTSFPEHLTFKPTWARFVARALVEAFRVIFPLAFMVGCAYNVVFVLVPFAERGVDAAAFGALVAISCGYGALSFLVACALKWVVMGRYEPGEHPMWTPWVWASEMVTSVYEALAVPNFTGMFRGTPLAPLWFKMLGVSVAMDTFLDTADVATEFDCTTIDRGVHVNAFSGMQTHLFEDRVMKVGRCTVARGATIDTRTVVLYGAVIGENAEVGPGSLVMKGEVVPPHSAWVGAPLQPWNKYVGGASCAGEARARAGAARVEDAGGSVAQMV